MKAVSLILGHMAYVIRNGRNDASLLNYDIELLAIYDVLLTLVTVVCGLVFEDMFALLFGVFGWRGQRK